MPTNKVKDKIRKLKEVIEFVEKHETYNGKIFVSKEFLYDLMWAIKHALFLEKKYSNAMNKLLLAKLKLRIAKDKLAYIWPGSERI